MHDPAPRPEPQPVHDKPLHRDWLTTHEVARLFDVDATTVTRWADEGRLEHRRTLGGHRRYPRAHIEQLASATRSTKTPVGTQDTHDETEGQA